MRWKYDDKWPVPEGMEPVYHQVVENGNGLAKRCVGYARFASGGPSIWYVKEDRSEAPVLPLLYRDKHWSVGWDISTEWAIDGAKNAYMSNAHGGALQRVKPEVLLEELGHPENLRRLFGLKPKRPEWVKEALKAGWTPAASYNPDDYEE